MNRKKTLKGIIFSALACIAIYSCTHVSGTYTSTNGSRSGSSMKDNCMDCHKTGATEGAFIVAGTVFHTDSVTRYPNGTVYLYSGPDSAAGPRDTVLASVEIDGVGNFYTTRPIDLSGGFYPVVVSSSGISDTMKSSTKIGSCNSCHGTSVKGGIFVH